MWGRELSEVSSSVITAWCFRRSRSMHRRCFAIHLRQWRVASKSLRMCQRFISHSLDLSMLELIARALNLSEK